MARYAWIITKDHIADPSVEPGTLCNAIGLIGPHGVTTEQVTRLEAGEGEEFRMYDDDKELYYEGRIILRPQDEGGELLFAPMEDFGEGNAGCTEIHYRNAAGKFAAI